MIKKLFVLVVFLFCCTHLLLCQIVTDTIVCSNYNVIIFLPEKCVQNATDYEEGYLKAYTFSDGSNIMINCGSMNKTPMLSSKNYKINEVRESNGLLSRKGLKDSIKYWREDNYNIYSFDILYDNTTKSKYILYDNLLDSIKFIKNK